MLAEVDLVAVSNFAVAAGTGVLAVFTWLGLKKADHALEISRRNAEDARRAADAAVESARVSREQVVEAQRDLDERTAPRLVPQDYLSRVREGDPYTMRLSNRGAAIAYFISIQVFDEEGNLIYEGEQDRAGQARPMQISGPPVEVPGGRPIAGELYLNALYSSEGGIQFCTRARLEPARTGWKLADQEIGRIHSVRLALPGERSP